MKYKISILICALIVLVLSFSYFFSPTVEVSGETEENRSMSTFKMIFNPVTDEKSVVYNADKNISDRFEDALKDQLFLRNFILFEVMNPLEGKLANMYSDTALFISSIGEGLEPLETGPANSGMTEVVETGDDLQDTGDDETEVPVVLDFEKYPGYGYARLKSFPKQNYSYRRVGTLASFNGTDWLGDVPSSLEGCKVEVAMQLVDQVELIKERYPDMRFYTYFVPHIQHTSWFSRYIGATVPDIHENIAQILPEYVKVDRFIYYDIDDYMDTNFKTDHHWSYKGSRRGYEDVYDMMAEDLDLSPIKDPIRTWNFTKLYGVEYVGSRGRTIRGYDDYDEFIVYEYELGERETFAVNPYFPKYEKQITLGLFNKYKAGEINMEWGYDHYINFYSQGYDMNGRKYADSTSMYVIKNVDSENTHNLLMVGDSTQRAYRDVIASHFNTTVYMDYRIMSVMPIDEIIDRYKIDVMLIGGITDPWYGDVYRFNMQNFEGVEVEE